jgi:hypothetical protein
LSHFTELRNGLKELSKALNLLVARLTNVRTLRQEFPDIGVLDYVGV